jgi:hypothetical protein
MYYLELFGDDYTPFMGIREIDSIIVPRPGDTIEDHQGNTFIVFDVSHCLGMDRCMVMVRAREASRMDRGVVYSENAYFAEANEYPRVGALSVSDELWKAVIDKLPKHRLVCD